MTPEDVKAKVENLIIEHNLIGWNFKFNFKKRQLGSCNHYYKFIALSKHWINKLSDEEITDVILHEFAHALVDEYHGHDYVWKSKATELGCNPEKCYKGAVRLERNYKAVCLNCGLEYTSFRNKRTNSSCSKCSGGKYNEKYKLTYVKVA